MSQECFECGQTLGHTDGCSRSRRFASGGAGTNRPAPPSSSPATPERRTLIEQLASERKTTTVPPGSPCCRRCGAVMGDVHKPDCPEHPDNRGTRETPARPTCEIHGTPLGGVSGTRCYQCKPGRKPKPEPEPPPEPEPRRCTTCNRPAPDHALACPRRRNPPVPSMHHPLPPKESPVSAPDPPAETFTERLAASYTREIAREEPPPPENRRQTLQDALDRMPAQSVVIAAVAPRTAEPPPARQSAPATSPRRPDPEVLALDGVLRALDGLDKPAIRRVLVWVGSRAGVLSDAAGYLFADQ